jgi:uncharacterized protein YndB with AHSA1/START domain
MTIVGVHKDPVARTLTITSEYGEPPDRVWRMWSDPRRLERWWGPPGYPATVDEHDVRPGGRVLFFVTGPDGARRFARWEVRVVEAPERLEFDLIDPDVPVITIRVRITAMNAGSRMVIEATFPSGEAMDELLLMGFAEGLSAAVEQLDDHL